MTYPLHVTAGRVTNRRDEGGQVTGNFADSQSVGVVCTFDLFKELHQST